VLTKVNAILARDNAESMFVTIFYAVLDLETGMLLFSSAGHDDGLLLSSSTGHEPLFHMGPAIGLIESSEYPTATRMLEPGDTLLLVTDGITEAFGVDGRTFSLDRIIKSATHQAYPSAHELVRVLNQEVADFSSGLEQSDDITCVALRFKGRMLRT
jgi:adenylate cyclase